MGDRTPKRGGNPANTGFSPVTLPESPAASPQKNLTGLPRVVRDLAADVYNTIQRWNDLHIKGASSVKAIASVKADNPKEFSASLEGLTSELYAFVQALRQYKNALLSYKAQMLALEKLQKQPEPLFISLDIGAMAALVETISNAYEAEFDVKETVLENIAHSRNKDEAMFLAALWTYQHKITDNVNFKLETLLTETGHRKIS